MRFSARNSLENAIIALLRLTCYSEKSIECLGPLIFVFTTFSRVNWVFLRENLSIRLNSIATF